ncbi:MAG: hypothetical protein EOP84_15510 [Verrucomicrobiaceae bacterium]|nr:MAG: hypothetical protein EOP84_15510 [Verrucomicrobiaceae bacterium]
MGYYVKAYGLEAGPYSVEQLAVAKSQGLLPSAVECRAEADSLWLPLCHHPDFSSWATEQSPDPKKAVDQVKVDPSTAQSPATATQTSPNQPSSKFRKFIKPFVATIYLASVLGIAIAVWMPMFKGNQSKSAASTAALAFMSVSAGLLVPGFLGKIYRSLAENETHEPTKGHSWKEAFEIYATNCRRTAQFYDRRSAIFLIAGLFTAASGIGFYALASLYSAEPTKYENELEAVAAHLKLVSGNLSGISSRFIPSAFSPNVIIVTHDESRDSSNICREAVEDMSREAKQLTIGLPALEESVKNAKDSFESDKSKFKWHRDLIPSIRYTTAFIFIEVIAGLFFALSRRSESHAISWRSHAQVYDRLINIPDLLSQVDFLRSSDKLPELFERLLISVPLSSADVPKDDNLTLETVKAIIEAARVVPKNSD